MDSLNAYTALLHLQTVLVAALKYKSIVSKKLLMGTGRVEHWSCYLFALMMPGLDVPVLIGVAQHYVKYVNNI